MAPGEGPSGAPRGPRRASRRGSIGSRSRSSRPSSQVPIPITGVPILRASAISERVPNSPPTAITASARTGDDRVACLAEPGGDRHGEVPPGGFAVLARQDPRSTCHRRPRRHGRRRSSRPPARRRPGRIPPRRYAGRPPRRSSAPTRWRSTRRSPRRRAGSGPWALRVSQAPALRRPLGSRRVSRPAAPWPHPCRGARSRCRTSGSARRWGTLADTGTRGVARSVAPSQRSRVDEPALA